MASGKRTSHEKTLHKSHLKNLMVLALSDGHFSEIEEHLLGAIAHRMGLSAQEIEETRNELHHISFVLPEKYEDRIDQFNDLLTLMAVDGKIDPKEEEACREIARKYELMESIVDETIKSHYK